MNRRRFIKNIATGLFVPLVARAQPFSFNDQPFMAQGGNGLLNSLVSYWKFDDPNQVIDSIGSNDWTLAGGTASQSGIINQTVGFGASLNTGFSQTAASSLQGGAGVSFTIQCWIRLSGAQNTNTSLFVRWDSATQAKQSYLLQLNGGNIIWAMRTAGNTYPSITVAQPADGVWTHLIAGFDSPGSRIFFQMNAGTRQFAASTSDVQTSTAVLCAAGGTTIDGANDAINGKIDECAWWTRVLTTADVGILYGNGGGFALGSFTT